jgi:ABC-type multidrug transport system fused ATPase/permease subunit
MISVLSTNLINSSRVNDILSQTEIGAKKVKSYTLDDARIKSFAKIREEQAEKSRFYKVYQANNIHYNVLTGLIIFIFFLLRKKGFSEIENALFSYGLAGASAANFLSFNFALYNRIWVIASIFILILVVIFLSKHRLNSSSVSYLKIRLPLFIFVIALLPYLFYQFSALLNFTSIYSIFMPLVILVEYDMGLSIRGFIGLFL